MKKTDWGVVVVCILVFLTRLPLLSLGYGLDSDAWRLALSARFISDGGEYTPSRLPGFPVHEYVSSLLWSGGPIALNMATLLVSLIGLFVFGLILKHLGIDTPWLGLLALASTPVFFINSVSTLDYMWALTFIFIAVHCSLRSKWWMAGLFIGIATGCRLTSIFMLLPITLLAITTIQSPGRLRTVLWMWVTALATGILCFIPVIMNQGFDFLRVSMGDYPDLAGVIRRGTTGVWGRLGLLGIALGVGWGILDKVRGNGKVLPAAAKAFVRPSVLCIGIYGLLYLAMPHESGYLIPAIPFLIVLFGVILPRDAYRIVCVLLILSPFFYVDVRYSPIEHHYRVRSDHLDLAQNVLARVEHLPERSVVVTGEHWRPILQTLALDREANSRVFVSTVSEEDLSEYHQQGYSIYCLEMMEGFLREMLQTRFEEWEIESIPLNVDDIE